MNISFCIHKLHWQVPLPYLWVVNGSIFHNSFSFFSGGKLQQRMTKTKTTFVNKMPNIKQWVWINVNINDINLCLLLQNENPDIGWKTAYMYSMMMIVNKFTEVRIRHQVLLSTLPKYFPFTSEPEHRRWSYLPFMLGNYAGKPVSSNA